MNFKSLTSITFLWAFLLTACASPSNFLPIEKIPAGNSEEIHVTKPYDFVYLAVFDAANSSDHWTPSQTLKDEGLMRLRNTQFSRFDDSSARVVNVRIRRDSLTQTSVFLEEDSRRVIGADEVLDIIRKKLATPTA